MKKSDLIIYIFLAMALFFPAAVSYAGMSGNNYTITTAVISGGGGGMTSSGFTANATLGETAGPPMAADNSYQLYPGFWFTLGRNTPAGDVNGDGNVDMADVLLILQIVTGQSAQNILLEADADGDGRIGLGEAIMVLRKLAEIEQ